jgi:hypothetical protein
LNAFEEALNSIADLLVKKNKDNKDCILWTRKVEEGKLIKLSCSMQKINNF